MRKILLPFYEIPTMAKIIKQLTIAQVNNAKAAEKIYYLFDGRAETRRQAKRRENVGV